MDLWRGSLTPRKAAVLAVHLPAGAMTWRVMGHDAAWTEAEHIAALLFDATQVGNWQRGDGKGPKPKPLVRPGDKAKSDRRTSAIEAKAKAFAARHSTPKVSPPQRKRDACGRFVRVESGS